MPKKLEATSKYEIEKTRNQIGVFIEEQQNRITQTLSYFENESVNKLNEINKCFVDACSVVEQIKNVEDKSENNQSKK